MTEPDELHIIALRSSNIILLLFGLFFLAIYTRTLQTIKIFHPNLRLLLFDIAATTLLLIVSRFVVLVNLFTNNFASESALSTELRVPAYIAAYAFSLSVVPFVIERKIALITPKTYEHTCNKFPVLGVVLLAIKWTASTFFVLATFQGALNLNTLNIVLVSVYGVSFLPSLLTQAIFVFLLLSRYFYERQRLRLFIKNQHSLSERYQLSENVRSAQLLIPLMAFMSATSSVATTIFNLNSRLAPIEFRPIGIDLYFMLRVLQVLYIFHFLLLLGPLRKILLRSVHKRKLMLLRESETHLDNTAIVAQLFVLLGHRSLRVELLSQLGYNAEPKAAVAINGQCIVVSSTAAQHFQELQSAWQ